jgi:hypothetical protein
MIEARCARIGWLTARLTEIVKSPAEATTLAPGKTAEMSAQIAKRLRDRDK